MAITVEDWIAAGYKKHSPGVIDRHAAFLLQKRFDDEVGKKYFITVYVYDRDLYPDHVKEHVAHIPRFGFMPTAHFSLGDNRPFFSIDMNGIESSEVTIADVEQYFERFWNFFDRPYYEEFHYE